MEYKLNVQVSLLIGIVGKYEPQMMDILDIVHSDVCRKSDFHRNSDFQNFQKLDPLQISAKKIQAKVFFQRYFGARN
jgi:hypothetical protein